MSSAGIIASCLSGSPTYTVAALLQFNGTDGSTSFIDETGKTWTSHASAEIDTAQSKFGGASGLFPGGGWINTAASDDFGFGDEDFTIAGWFRRPASQTGGDRCAVDTRTGTNAGCAIYMSADLGNDNYLCYATNTLVVRRSDNRFPADQWCHWAVCRSEADIFGFIDGVSQWTSLSDSRTFASNTTCFIGDNYAASSQPLNGWLDSTIIIKGAALYTSDFTPPASPYSL